MLPPSGSVAGPSVTTPADPLKPRKEAFVAFIQKGGCGFSSRRAPYHRSLVLTVILAISLGATVAGAQQQGVLVPPVKVTLVADGETREILSTGKTVQDLLEEHQIALGEN